MTDRFRPPPVEASAALEWVLGRALGPAGHPLSARPEPAAAERIARELLLAGRIGRRTAPERLVEELGEGAAERFAAEARSSTAVQMQFRATCQAVAEVAAGLSIPLVFLKGMALQLSGLVAAGDRVTADVDVLVPSESCHDLQEALIERGFRHSFEVAMCHPHQMPPLWHPQLLGVEVHRAVAGLRLEPGATTATAGQLLDSRRCRPLDGLPGPCHVPRLDLLVAHLAVHAVVQHPDTGAYFFRMLGDLQAALEAGGGDEDLLGSAAAWVSWLVPEEELRGLGEMALALGRGDGLALLVKGDTPAEVDLRHFVAVTVDRGYRARQGLEALLTGERTDDLSRRRYRLPRLWWPRREVLAADGRPLTRLAFARWWLGRPLGMMGGLWRALHGRPRSAAP